MSSTLQDKIKISACVDEYDDDISKSITGIKSLKLDSLSILNLYGRQVSELTPDTLNSLRTCLSGLKTEVVALDLGYKSISGSNSIDGQLSIAKYFNSKYVVIGLSKSVFNSDAAVTYFFEQIVEKTISLALIPMLDINTSSYYCEPELLVKALERFRKIKLLYDPCRFMEKSNTRPFSKWWPHIRSSVGAIVVRDYKTGYGFYPAGHGDCGLVNTVSQYLEDGNNLLIFKPSLGRRYGSAIGRRATFELALESLQQLLRTYYDAKRK